MTAPLFMLQAQQSAYVFYFDCSRRDPPNKALAFQSRERAFRGLSHNSKIIREIVTVHRQPQQRSLSIEEIRELNEVENEGRNTLTGVQLSECYDSFLGLATIIHHLHKQVQLEVFNSILRRERGTRPLSEAPNWLMISICYAELSGYPVQVLSYSPLPATSLDLLRLGADRAQMVIGADQSAEVTFSDVSRPGLTTNWRLQFDRHGQITSVAHAVTRQAENIALKP